MLIFKHFKFSLITLMTHKHFNFVPTRFVLSPPTKFELSPPTRFELSPPTRFELSPPTRFELSPPTKFELSQPIDQTMENKSKYVGVESAKCCDEFMFMVLVMIRIHVVLDGVVESVMMKN